MLTNKLTNKENTCQVCGRTFSSKQAYYGHKKGCKPMVPSIETLKKMKEYSQKCLPSYKHSSYKQMYKSVQDMPSLTQRVYDNEEKIKKIARELEDIKIRLMFQTKLTETKNNSKSDFFIGLAAGAATGATVVIGLTWLFSSGIGKIGEELMLHAGKKAISKALK